MKTYKTCKDYIAEYEKSTIVVNFGKPADVRYMKREVWIFHKFIDDNDILPLTQEFDDTVKELCYYDNELYKMVMIGLDITIRNVLTDNIDALFYD